MEKRHEEGQGFSAASLCFNSEVVVFEQERYGCFLDWEHRLVIVPGQRGKYLFSELDLYLTPWLSDYCRIMCIIYFRLHLFKGSRLRFWRFRLVLFIGYFAEVSCFGFTRLLFLLLTHYYKQLLLRPIYEDLNQAGNHLPDWAYPGTPELSWDLIWALISNSWCNSC